MKREIGFSALVLSLAAAVPFGFPQNGQNDPVPVVPGPPLIAWSYLQQPRPVSYVSDSQAVDSKIYEGMITDTHCGAKHSALIGKSAADCTRICVHGGEQFVLVDGEQVYLLEGDLQALKRVAGQRVRILGRVDGEKLSVIRIAAA